MLVEVVFSQLIGKNIFIDQRLSASTTLCRYCCYNLSSCTSLFVLILFCGWYTMNHNEEFIKEIFHYFVNDSSKYSPSNVIKRHSEKLADFGDYSFPITIRNWAHFLPPLQPLLSHDNIFAYRESRCANKFPSIAEHIDDLVQSSRKWALQIERAVIKENRCAIYLNRCNAFQSTIDAVLNDRYFGRYEGRQSYVIVRKDTIPEEKELLTRYRCRVIENVIGNLTKHLTGPTRSLLHVTHKSTDTHAPDGCTQIFVGNVTSSDNKLLNVEAEEYIK